VTVVGELAVGLGDFGHNFTYLSTLVGDVLVKFCHDVFAAVYGGRGAILIELRDAMTAEPGHIMFVDNFGMSRVVVVVVVVVGGCEERLEVCHEEERDGVLLFLVGEFQLTIFVVGTLDLLRRVLETERNVSFVSCWVGERVEATVTHVSYTIVFGSVCH